MAYASQGLLLYLNMGSGPVAIKATSLSVTAPEGEVTDVTGLWNPTSGTRDLVATGDVMRAGTITMEILMQPGVSSWAWAKGTAGTLDLSDTTGNIPSRTWNVFLTGVEERYNVGGLAVETLTFSTED